MPHTMHTGLTMVAPATASRFVMVSSRRDDRSKAKMEPACAGPNNAAAWLH
jgi:hypothetical protein